MSEMRKGRELIQASKEFSKENRGRSWFHFFETFFILSGLLAAVAVTPWWYVKLPMSIILGLVVVRAFILYHDYMHNAFLRGSKFAKWVFYLFGVLVITPPNVWRQTHNYHHAHTAKLVGSHVGSYLMVTTDMWEKMSGGERFMYKLIRHPLTILFGYFTIFLWGMCASSFIRNPKKNWDSALALVVNLALTVGIWGYFGFEAFFFTMFVPLFVATAAGGYLFYAQHNFPEMEVQPRHEWEYTHAAINSSSMMITGPILGWFTGQIGYHHVHHLNSGIPFYRLKEAMDAMPELQSPKTTSLHPRDIAACFKLKLWDPEAGQMVGYPSGKQRSVSAA